MARTKECTCLIAISLLTCVNSGCRRQEVDQDALNRAASVGDVDAVKRAIADGADVNWRSADGRTVLHRALSTISGTATASSAAVVRVLTDNGADVNSTTPGGFSVLYWAVWRGASKDTIRFLLANGADPSIATDDGKKPLHMALEMGQAEVTEILAEREAELDVFTLAGLGRIKELTELLDDRPALARTTHLKGITPLHYAAVGEHEATVRLLLQRGADINAKGTVYEQTPLRWTQSADIAKILLSRGADPNAEDMSGGTPLHYVASWDHRDMVKVLIHNRARVDARDKKGRTPIFAPCRRGYRDVVALLLSEGADPNVADESGRTPLHEAARWGADEIVELLLAKGARVGAKNREGKTPLDEASEHACEKVVALLKAKAQEQTPR